jgi:hypothetical protein
MLGMLERFTRRTRLTVNLEKTKVVAFGARLSGKARAEMAFFFEVRRVEFVASYIRYLGVKSYEYWHWSQAEKSLSEHCRSSCLPHPALEVHGDTSV